MPPLGFLDAAGRATVAIALPSGMNPDVAGLWAHHAFFTWNGAGIAFASEAERVKLVD